MCNKNVNSIRQAKSSKQDAHIGGLGVIMRQKCDNDDDLRSLSSSRNWFLSSTIGIVEEESFMIDSNYGLYTRWNEARIK